MKTLLRIIIKLFALTLFRIAIFFAATASEILNLLKIKSTIKKEVFNEENS